MNSVSKFRRPNDTSSLSACDYVRRVLRPRVAWDRLGRDSVQSFRDGRSYVYFVGGDTGLIKIGTSLCPLERMAALHLHSPIALKFLLLVEGSSSEEERYHRRFASLRVRGEWFERAPELVSFIERTRKRQLRALLGSYDTCEPLGKVA